MKFQTLLCSDGNESFIAHHLDKRSDDDNLTNSKISAIRTRLIFYFILVLRQAMKDDVEGNYKKENEKREKTSKLPFYYTRFNTSGATSRIE